MSFPLPLMCCPDQYLSRGHLQELFNDYMSASHPTGSSFTLLVNNVRMLYVVALMEANTALHEQQTRHASQLAELKAQHERERATVPVALPQGDGGAAPQEPLREVRPPADLTGSAGDVVVVETAEMERVQPQTQDAREIMEQTDILYISRDQAKMHDRVSWSALCPFKGFSSYMTLRVFKTAQPGTRKVVVLTHTVQDRIWVVWEPEWLRGHEWTVTGGVHELAFWAYPEARVGAQRVWVAAERNNTGRRFVDGSHGVPAGDWERTIQFWVPV